MVNLTKIQINCCRKLWNYCNVFRDDGLSYGDYVEQLTFLLYLKMAHERTQPPWNQESTVPDGYDWPSLTNKDGLELRSHYRDLLEHLGTHDGMIGVIFRKAQNRIQDPAKLRRLIVDLIDTENYNHWMPMSRVMPTRACWRKMLRTLRVAQANTSHSSGH